MEDIKNLPIKLFKKRDNTDDRRTEGGGSDELPKWVLTGEELIIKSRELLAKIDEAQNLLANRLELNNYLPAILKVSIKDKAIAKTHRAHVGKIFNVNHKSNFIGMSDECDLLVKVDNIQDAREISKNISLVSANAHGLSSIDEMNLFSPFIEVGSDIVKARLINYNNYSINQVVDALFIDMLRKKGIIFKKTKYTFDLTI